MALLGVSSSALLSEASNSRAALIALADGRKRASLIKEVARHTDSLNFQLYIARNFKDSGILQGLVANPLLHSDVVSELKPQMISLDRSDALTEREVRRAVKRSITESSWIGRAFGPLTRYNYLTDQCRPMSFKLLCVEAPAALDLSVGYHGWDVLFTTLESWHGDLFELPKVVATLL